jgi:4-amino-4-deoxy-L-arabinose transferase-like glycosyltransferase
LNRIPRSVVWLCVLAFALRLGTILIAPGHFWAYTVYYDMARVVAGGGGYCMSPGMLCAYFPPVYPTIVAACILTGHPMPAIMIAGSLAGAGTVWLTFLTGRRLFGEFAGWLAAACAAVYPYFVWHDAVLQETATLTLVVAASIYLLVRSNHSNSRRLWLSAGTVLGLTVLTKANLLLFVPLALGWMWFFGRRRVLWVALGVTLTLGPWVARTWRITGSPVLYSNGGMALWAANHAQTFDYFPEKSIDEASDAEYGNLSAADKRELEALNDPQGLGQARWYWNNGMEFILANPGLTLKRAIYKIWIAFSPVFSPAKPGWFQAVYFLSYFPLLVLTAAGVWLSRRKWRELGILYILVLSFALGTAALWGHTSHRMYVEPYLMIFAAYFVAYFVNRRGYRSIE